MMRTVLVLGLALLVAAPAARAQAPAPAPAVAPAAEAEARLAAAQRLMQATGAIAMAGQMMDGIQQQLITVLTQLNPGKAAEVQGLVVDVLMPEFRARIGEIEAPTLRIWADAFTVAEMDQLVAFYGTPLGRKSLEVMPQVAQQSQAVGMAWGQRVAQDAIAKHERTIRERGIRL